MKPFEPNKTQRLAKARFWAALASNPMLDPTCLTDVDIGHMAATTSIDQWKTIDGFTAWFTDDKAVDVLIEAGVEASIQKLLSIIGTHADDVGPRETVSTTHQLAAIKELLAYSTLKPAADEKKVLDPADLPDDLVKLQKLIEDGLAARKQRTLTVAGDE